MESQGSTVLISPESEEIARRSVVVVIVVVSFVILLDNKVAGDANGAQASQSSENEATKISRKVAAFGIIFGISWIPFVEGFGRCKCRQMRTCRFLVDC